MPVRIQAGHVVACAPARRGVEPPPLKGPTHARVLIPIEHDPRLMTGRPSRRGRANTRRLKTRSAYKAVPLVNSYEKVIYISVI